MWPPEIDGLKNNMGFPLLVSNAAGALVDDPGYEQLFKAVSDISVKSQGTITVDLEKAFIVFFRLKF